MWFRHEEGRREGHPPRKIVENEKKKGRRNSKGKPMILFL